MSNVITDIETGLEPVTGRFQSIGTITKRGQDELLFWNDKKETDIDAFPRLKEYWDYVNFGNNWSPSGTPWSSAFISYVLRDQDFPKKAAHRLYIKDIVDGKHQTWGAYSIPKTEKLQLHVGDVLIKPRSGDYNNSHGDVVYKIENGQAFLIGGNLGNTARVTEIFRVDQNGFILEDASPYQIILKKKRSGSVVPFLTIGLVMGSILFLRRNMK